MKSLKTAPQILEHYVWENTLYCIDIPSEFSDVLLKAMRHYARIKSDKAKDVTYSSTVEHVGDKLREEVKDEMYEEAYQNIRKQYNLK